MIGQNLRHALRALAKNPFISVIAIVWLSLGIGANAAVFSLYYNAMLAPLPVPSPYDLVNLVAPGPKPGSHAATRAGSADALFSYPMFRDLERLQTSFTGLAAHRTFAANLASGGQTVSATGALVSGGYFGVLNLRPARGRLIDSNDDRTRGRNRR